MGTRVCPKCGVEGDFKGSHCKPCNRARVRAWQEANKEKVLERRKAYYEANKEKILECNKAWREANKEKKQLTNKAWYEANKEKMQEYNKAWREANKERIKAYNEANKERKLEHNARRKARKRNAIPRHLRNCPVEKERLANIYRLRKAMSDATGVDYHVDHMWPLSDGGPHWSGNLQIITAEENLSKGQSVDKEVKRTIKEMLRQSKKSA